MTVLQVEYKNFTTLLLQLYKVLRQAVNCYETEDKCPTKYPGTLLYSQVISGKINVIFKQTEGMKTFINLKIILSG